ncbi:MAG: LacI family DNA-binding transcriptional regulator [Candidatus Promineifilaceae bacterium]
MPTRSRVTIKEIAEEAGVSMQTVSRVINNRPDVAPMTRQRVKDIIDKHDYRPSSIARGITKGRSYLLGVVTAGIRHFGPSSTLSGIEKQASKMGYSTILRAVHQTEEFDIDEYLRFLVSQHVDGIIWAMPERGNIREEILTKIPQLAIPAVFINLQPHPDINVFDFDNLNGGRMATKHLIEQGFERIGLISGPMDWMVSRQRFLGWKDVLKIAGYESEDKQITEGDWTAESGARCMTRLLNQWPEIDAVFACNDLMALGAMKVASNSGRCIPDDLAVVGFDDIAESNFFTPSLTTVRQDPQDLGRRSVVEIDRLISVSRKFEEKPGKKTHIFQMQLIVRESSIKR